MKGKFFYNQALAGFVGSLVALSIAALLAYVIYKNEYSKPTKPIEVPPAPKQPEETEPEKKKPVKAKTVKKENAASSNDTNEE